MKTIDWNIVPFPCASGPVSRRILRKDLRNAVRASGGSVIVDFSQCRSLHHEDIDLLLECMAMVAGRDTKMVVVAGSRENRVIFDMPRSASLGPVFNSVEEARADPKAASGNGHETGQPAENRSQTFGSA